MSRWLLLSPVRSSTSGRRRILIGVFGIAAPHAVSLGRSESAMKNRHAISPLGISPGNFSGN
jgi:hypothetical protein